VSEWLETLNVANNGITNFNVIAQSVHRSHVLSTLVLDDNDVRDEIVTTLRPSLDGPAPLRYLSLRGHTLSEKGLQTLKGILKSNAVASTIRLDLTSPGHTDTPGFKKIIATLRKDLPKADIIA
jgi:hypothetical protein